MPYYRKYNGGGFYDKKSGRWISAERAHQRVGESIGGWTKRRARDGSYYMERDDDWSWDRDDEEDYEKEDYCFSYDDIPEYRLRQKVGESINGYTKRVGSSGKFYMSKDDNFYSSQYSKPPYRAISNATREESPTKSSRAALSTNKLVAANTGNRKEATRERRSSNSLKATEHSTKRQPQQAVSHNKESSVGKSTIAISPKKRQRLFQSVHANSIHRNRRTCHLHMARCLRRFHHEYDRHSLAYQRERRSEPPRSASHHSQRETSSRTGSRCRSAPASDCRRRQSPSRRLRRGARP